MHAIYFSVRLHAKISDICVTQDEIFLEIAASDIVYQFLVTQDLRQFLQRSNLILISHSVSVTQKVALG